MLRRRLQSGDPERLDRYYLIDPSTWSPDLTHPEDRTVTVSEVAADLDAPHIEIGTQGAEMPADIWSGTCPPNTDPVLERTELSEKPADLWSGPCPPGSEPVVEQREVPEKLVDLWSGPCPPAPEPIVEPETTVAAVALGRGTQYEQSQLAPNTVTPTTVAGFGNSFGPEAAAIFHQDATAAIGAPNVCGPLMPIPSATANDTLHFL